MFVAVDTNVLMDLALPRDAVHDAVALVRQRAKGAEIIVPPTVLEELDHIATHGDSAADRRLATTALQKLAREWKFRPLDFIPVGHGIAETIAAKLRQRGVIPAAEINDSLILAEAALANCAILLTSDHHLAEADPAALTLALKECDVATVLVQTPASLIRRFSPKPRRN